VKLGIALRSMGSQSTRQTFLECARSAEVAGFDDLWVQDHIAIAPDDSEGSGGRYLDPLAALAFLAGATDRIGLGTGVLVLPYREKLATAKWVATVQELSQGRLLLGVGVGWLQSEFNALGVDRKQRGRISDETLEFIGRCFAADEVEQNGQPFLFLPRPPRPPIFVGGAPPHALERAARFADGWMPMGGDPERLAEPIARLRELALEAGKPAPEVVLMTGFPLDDPARAAAQVHAYAEIGVTHCVSGGRYADANEFRRNADALAKHVLPVVADLR
jgi:probable F420-dependent oxidoreductase